MLSVSREQDAGFRALADVAALTAGIGAEHRILGGNMVGVLLAVFEVTGVPARDTADADVGAPFEVLADPRLVPALRGAGYRQEAGNRFVRDSGGLTLAIDLLAPSYTSRHQPNQPHGELIVDEVPGLSLALRPPGLPVRVTAELSTGERLDFTVSLPEPRAALAVKALAWNSRAARRDAIDVWRLLEVAAVAGLTPADWPERGGTGDARLVLARDFGRFTGAGARAASGDRRTRLRISALVAAHVVAQDGVRPAG